MKKFCFLLLQLITLLFICAGCAEDEPQDNSAPGSDIAGAFMDQEPRTYHKPKYQPNDFFYKQCEDPHGFCSEH